MLIFLPEFKGLKSIYLINRDFIQLIDEPAEYFAHHTDELKGTGIADAVIHSIGVLAGAKNPFVPKNRQVLRNVTLGGSDEIHDVLDRKFPAAKNAKNFEAKGMRHGLDGPGSLLDMLVPVDEFVLDCRLHFGNLSGG
jgi:hypothetical protein